VTHLGKVLPDHGACQRAAMTARLIGVPRGARAAAREGFLAQVTGVQRAEVLGRVGYMDAGNWARYTAGRRVAVWISPPSTDRGAGSLLIASQIVLGLQLPFALVPLIRFNADRTKMGRYANAHGQCAGIDRRRNDHCLGSPRDCRCTAIGNTGKG